MLENKRVQKLREFWISIAYFRASTVFNFKTNTESENEHITQTKSYTIKRLWA